MLLHKILTKQVIFFHPIFLSSSPLPSPSLISLFSPSHRISHHLSEGT
uniref:Uncharacterized protein n=1 Tax=Arundo donax TaxID=35708 RepID=A0A0A8YVU7_ARUDO